MVEVTPTTPSEWRAAQSPGLDAPAVEEAKTLVVLPEEFPRAEAFKPESHYKELERAMLAAHPKADPEVVLHLVFLTLVLDVARAFGVSMKFDKSQFVQISLVFERSFRVSSAFSLDMCNLEGGARTRSCM